MNEFIKALIERLEFKGEELDQISSEHTLSKTDKERNYGYHVAISHAIEIVNQLAGEYKNESTSGDLVSRKLLIEKIWEKHKETADYYELFTDELRDMFCSIVAMIDELPTACNDGWIPCSERLPEVDGIYIVTFDDGYISSAPYFDGDWELWCDSGEPIAWQPLPAPYQPKGE